MDTIAVPFEQRNDVFCDLVGLLGNVTNTIHNRKLALAVRVRTTMQVEPCTVQRKIESSSAAFDLKDCLCKRNLFFA